MSVPVGVDRVVALAALLEPLQFMALPERVLALVRDLLARGEEAFAHPWTFLAEATSSSTTAQTYKFELAHEDGLFVITSIQHPADGTADIVCSRLEANGFQYVHTSALMDAWCDAESSEDARGLPWPIVMGSRGSCTIEVTGTGLPSTSSAVPGLIVRGFRVDKVTASVLRFVGELFVEGFNKTYSAAAVMTDDIPRTFDREKEFTHLVAKETLTGDAARALVEVQFRSHKLHPKSGNSQKVVPPLSLRKAGARISIAVGNNDRALVSSRYTSAGAAGTAKLQVTGIGRARYAKPAC